MQIFLIYENESFKSLEILCLFQTLKYSVDSLTEIVYCEKMEIPKGENIITISIFKNKEIDAFFKVKILDSVDKMYMNVLNYQIILNDLDKTLENILYNIYNYKKIKLIDDLEGEESIIIYELFIEQKLGIEYPDEIFLKEEVKTNSLKNYKKEKYSRCCKNDKLVMILKNVDLICTDGQNTFIIKYFDNEIYFKHKNTLRNDVFDYITDKSTNKAISEYFKKYKHIEQFNVLTAAFTKNEFDGNINEKFNDMINFINKKQKNITSEILLEIINALPKYNDHRKKYLEKLVKTYIKLYKIEKKSKKPANVRKVQVLDRIPVGSLKHEYYKKK